MIKVYTDGSWDSKSKQGGWGFYLYIGDKCKEGSGYSPKTTSNRMELVAIYEALLAVESLPKEYQERPIRIYTDSMYCVNHLKRESPENALNSKMITRCLDIMKSRNCTVRHVKGHNGDIYNEYVDKLAVMARFKGRKKIREAVRANYEGI